MERVIEVEGLKKAFGSHEVLKGVDFVTHKGEVTCIIGSSGSGKSTLLRCINLLETPDEGRILYHGDDILSGSVNMPRDFHHLHQYRRIYGGDHPRRHRFCGQGSV